MRFMEIVEEARFLLERNGRVSLGALEREYPLDTDLDALVSELVEVQRVACREGNVLERFSERLRAGFPGITIDPNIDYRTENVRTEVEEIASQVNTDPQDASVRIVGSEVEVADSRDGYELDVAGTMAPSTPG